MRPSLNRSVRVVLPLAGMVSPRNVLKASFSALFNVRLNSPVPLRSPPSPSVRLRPSVDVLRQLGAQSGSGFDGFKSWTASGAPAKCSTYYGVACDAEGKIVAIYVPSARLVGPIDALSSLDQLQRLNVCGCSIKGRIPAFLGQLTSLTYLGIGDNSFEGAVPSSLGSLVKLIFLNIAGTGEDGVGGALPSSFANLKKLKELYLDNNRFSGPLPDFIGSFTHLEQLMVSKNRWEGVIPKTFSKLKKLRLLGLMETALEGEIPTFLGKLSHLTYLSLSSTRLHGEVPSERTVLRLPGRPQHPPAAHPHVRRSPAAHLPSTCRPTGAHLPPTCPPTWPPLCIPPLCIPPLCIPPLCIPPLCITSIHLTLSLSTLPTPHSPLPTPLCPLPSHPTSDLSGNYFSGPIPAFLQQVQKVNAEDNYFSGSASSLSCSDDFSGSAFSLGGNCLSSVPPNCGESAAQKSAAECNKFCGTATAAGACSGKGVCVMGVDESRGTKEFVPMCRCQAGYWASHQKQRCSKNSS
ncbi:unnamed protein product [Closterium sp. Naga37s-1]|nr:unnamed protein product [Closterium sp. Naga37s-1]